jgi:hypothetical protein
MVKQSAMGGKYPVRSARRSLHAVSYGFQTRFRLHFHYRYRYHYRRRVHQLQSPAIQPILILAMSLLMLTRDHPLRQQWAERWVSDLHGEQLDGS